MRITPTFAGTSAFLLVAALGVTTITARQAGPDRSKPPAAGPAPTLKTPPIQRRTLSNGLPVWIVEMHQVPVVDVSVIINSGAAADPAGKFGLAHFTADMLDEGAGSRGALELSDAVDFLGASLTTSSSFDASSVHLHALTSKFDAALPILADVLLRPTFPAQELERVRKDRLTSLLQIRDEPPSLASAALVRVLYGPQHRYGTLTMGGENANGSISAADLKAFYTAHYQPQNAALLIVGDVTPASLLPKLESVFGAWKSGAPVADPPAAAVAEPASRRIYVLDKPGAPQSQIRMGWVGVARTTPDYFTLDVLNTLLGGTFTSRLNMNLREAHGYTYGAGSRFDMRKTPGPFYATASVQTDKTVESLREFFKEMDAIHEPVAADELARIRNLEALGFPSEFETTADMASQLGVLEVYHLPDTFFSDYVPMIQKVSPAELQRVARQNIQSDHFAVIVVGDLSKIEKPIRDANLGPVEILNAADILK